MLKKSTKKYAVIGAGFSGLAICWYLLNSSSPLEVTLFCKGNEASRVSAGILHKYMGLYAKLNPVAIEAEKESRELISKAQQFTDHPIILSCGIVRHAISDKQKIAYAKSAESYPDVTWFDNCQSYDINMAPGPGIFIESGLTLDTNLYLDALKQGCIGKGLTVKIQKISHIDELEDYDHVIGAMGSYTSTLKPFENLSLHPLKGQLLEINWPKDLPPLPYTIISQIYLAMSQDSDKAIIGATYEHHFKDASPDSDYAVQNLMPKALEIYPKLAGCMISEVRAGIRATTPTRMPTVKVLSNRYSVIAGMGSSGLLYHAHFAKQLVDEILKASF